MNCCSIKDYLTCLITLSTHLKPLLTHFKALLTHCSGKTFYFVYFSLGLSDLCLFFCSSPVSCRAPRQSIQRPMLVQKGQTLDPKYAKSYCIQMTQPGGPKQQIPRKKIYVCVANSGIFKIGAPIRSQTPLVKFKNMDFSRSNTNYLQFL